MHHDRGGETNGEDPTEQVRPSDDSVPTEAVAAPLPDEDDELGPPLGQTLAPQNTKPPRAPAPPPPPPPAPR